MTSKVRVAIAGVGNCSSSLIQGVRYYRDAKPEDRIPGLMHVDLGGYHVRDVEFVAAFDVDDEKVGKDLSQAIFAGQNNTYKFSDVPELGVTVQRGPTLDGLGKYLRQVITESEAQPVDVAQVLRDAKADVLINYLPVGSERARASTPSRRWRPASASSTASRCSSPRIRNGGSASRMPACRSSATTSRARSAPRSPTAC